MSVSILPFSPDISPPERDLESEVIILTSDQQSTDTSFKFCHLIIVPVFGGVATSFGRKPVLLAAIATFAIGSAICGSANTMGQMIAGRTIQGVGVSFNYYYYSKLM